MAVTVTWVEFTGVYPQSGVGSWLVANLNLGNTDAVNLVPASYPIAAGSNSYGKYIKLQWSGSFTQISNAKLWKSAGAYKTDEELKFSGGYVKYAAPSTTDVTASGSWLGGITDIPTSQPGSANIILPITTTNVLLQSDYESTPDYGSGARSGMVVFQLQSSASTEAGAVNQKTISLTYDRQ